MGVHQARIISPTQECRNKEDNSRRRTGYGTVLAREAYAARIVFPVDFRLSGRWFDTTFDQQEPYRPMAAS